jgi:hypothetical protein
MVLTAVVALAWTTGLRAQLPATPVPVAPQADTAPPLGLGPPLPPPTQPAHVIPPPPTLPPPLDPGRDGWATYGCPSAPPTVFFDVELAFLGPAVKNRLFNTVARPDASGTLDTVHAPSANLEWTVAPKFEVGFRLPDSAGAFVLGYRFIASEGTTTTTIDGVDLNVKSRLNVNVFDLDYATARYEFVPRWESQFRVGARLANFFYDSRIFDDFALQKTSNNYFGAGPHVTADLQRRIVVLPGLSFFSVVDGTVLIGQVRQRFTEQLTSAAGDVDTSEFTGRRNQAIPGLSLQAGLGYTPPSADYLHFRVGYQFERYWNLGRLDTSNLELTAQGVFVRGEVDF